MKMKEILSEALELPPIERASLVEQIILSFQLPDRDLIDQLWANEAEDRIKAYDQNKIKAINADEVFHNIDQEL